MNSYKRNPFLKTRVMNLLMAAGLAMAYISQPAWADASKTEEGKDPQWEALDPGMMPVVRVFYGTDRMPIPGGTGAQYGNGKGDGQIHYGKAEAVLAVNYRRNPSKYSSWLGFQPGKPDSPSKVGFQEIPEGAFKREIGKDKSKATFIFIHGYNNSFQSAAFRTAKIAYDLQLQGTPLMYSWPSANSLFGFGQDLEGADSPESVGHCADFLRLVLRHSASGKVNLLAHSMGSRILCKALLKMDRRDFHRLGSVILIAPEIDVRDFKEMYFGKGGLLGKCGRKHPFLVYASGQDYVLLTADALGGGKRLGQGGKHAPAIEGLTTIDATQVSVDWGLGHELDHHDGVINDLYLYLNQGLPESRRLLTLRPKRGESTYELFDGVQEIRKPWNYSYAVGGQAGLQDESVKVSWFCLGNYLQPWLALNRGFLNPELDLRLNLSDGEWRPYLQAGIASYRTSNLDTLAGAGALRFGGGLERIFETGWAVGLEIDGMDKLWPSGAIAQDAVLDSLFNNRNFPWDQIHLQLTKYFDIDI